MGALLIDPRGIARHTGQVLPTPFAEAANWSFANYAFAPTWDIMLDNTKARRMNSNSANGAIKVS